MKPLLSKEELTDLLSPLGTELEPQTEQSDKQSQLAGQLNKSTPTGCQHTSAIQLRIEAGRCQLSAKELLELTTGSLLIMDQAQPNRVELYLNDQLIGSGTPVMVDNKIGIKLSTVAIPEYLRNELADRHTPNVS